MRLRSLVRAIRREFHSDSRQVGWNAGHVRVTNAGDAPVTPIKGSPCMQKWRRRAGRATDGRQVLLVLLEALAEREVDITLLSAAAQRAGELRCLPALTTILTIEAAAERLSSKRRKARSNHTRDLSEHPSERSDGVFSTRERSQAHTQAQPASLRSTRPQQHALRVQRGRPSLILPCPCHPRHTTPRVLADHSVVKCASNPSDRGAILVSECDPGTLSEVEILRPRLATGGSGLRRPAPSASKQGGRKRRSRSWRTAKRKPNGGRPFRYKRVRLSRKCGRNAARGTRAPALGRPRKTGDTVEPALLRAITQRGPLRRDYGSAAPSSAASGTVAFPLQRRGFDLLTSRRVFRENAAWVGIVFTAAARCYRAGSRLAPAARARIVGSYRRRWRQVACVKNAPMFGAALAFCASLNALPWARDLYEGVRAEANVIHFSCYARVLAQNGLWDEVAREWFSPTGPQGNGGVLAGLIQCANSSRRLWEVWRLYSGEIELSAPLLAACMKRFLVLGAPEGVVYLEEHRVSHDVQQHVVDRFGNKRFVTSLWKCRALAHRQLYFRTGDDSFKAKALEQVGEALLPHICRGAPEKDIAFFKAFAVNSRRSDGHHLAKK